MECLNNLDMSKYEMITWYTKESFVYRMINNTLRKGRLLEIYYIRVLIFLLDE